MYKIKVYDIEECVALDLDGAVSLRISETGLVQAGFYTGAETLYKMCDGDRIEKLNMTEEEILDTEGLGEWWKKARASAEAANESKEVH